MKKQIISVIGLGALTNLGCGLLITTNPPPKDNVPTIKQGSLPKWEDVEAPNEGKKAELIVTESGCFKAWIDTAQTPNDRFEEKGQGIEIQCPERAKGITKEKEDISAPPEPIRRNPPPPQE